MKFVEHKIFLNVLNWCNIPFVMASNEILTLQNLISILFASLSLLTMCVNLYIIKNHFNYFYMYSSVALNTLHWCATITTTPLQNFLIISHWDTINHSSPFSLPTVLGNHYSAFYEFDSLGTSWKWNHTIFVLLSSWFIHAAARVRISFFFKAE